MTKIADGDQLRKEIEEMFNYYDQLASPKVRDYVYGLIHMQCFQITKLLEQCESPIEQLFGIAFEPELARFNDKYNTYFYLHPQKEIQCQDETYRVDFFIESLDENYPEFVIECDGHDFHEKTKEQVARDKKRERALQQAGFTVIRFSGSEIWKNAYRCAIEALKVIAATCGFEYRR